MPTFDVDLLEIIEAEYANDVAQSLLRILQFKVEGELGEGQVFYLQELDEVIEVSEHSTHIDEGADVNEDTSLSGSVTTLGKGMWWKHKGMQPVHPFTIHESYKRREVGDGLSVEDFVDLPKSIQIISKLDVDVFVDILTRWLGSPR